MMKNLFRNFTLFIATLAMIGSFAVVPAANALDITEKGSSSDSGKALKNDGGEDFTSTMQRVITTLLFVLGIIAVIIIIIGGVRFATANGDATAIKNARNTILYACVGLFVAMMSYAIVMFILDRFKS